MPKILYPACMSAHVGVQLTKILTESRRIVSCGLMASKTSRSTKTSRNLKLSVTTQETFALSLLDSVVSCKTWEKSIVLFTLSNTMGFLRAASLIVILSVCFFHGQAEGKKCVRFEDSPLRRCAAAGYNYTYALPDDLSARTTGYIVRLVNYLSNAMVNCSVAQIAEAITCMSYAPKCVDADRDPVLPCRRVCSELLKRCSGTIREYLVDWMTQRCLVLPNATAKSGKCFEPKQFDKHYNASSKGPLERGCQPLVNFPFCDGMGYKYTIPTPQGQLKTYKFFYGKNITDGDRTKPSNKSILHKIMWRVKNTPKCGKNIHKMFCSEVVPPCFPPEEKAYYTMCKPICDSIGEQCPELLEGRGAIYYKTCERLAPGNTSHGYCKHTKIPPIIDWADYFRESPTPTPSKGLSTTTTIIIIAVIVSVVIIVVIISLVILYMKRKKSDLFNYQRHE